jgi:hypothetical protein
MHMSGGLRRRGSKVRVVHIADVLAGPEGRAGADGPAGDAGPMRPAREKP